MQLVALPTMIVCSSVSSAGEPVREPLRHPARVVEQAARLQRQPAAVLLGHDHLEAVVLEHRDDALALPRLVVLGAAAMEVDERGVADLQGCVRLRAQREKRRPAKRGAGASRCTPSVFSARIRSGRERSVQLAIGATGVPARPSQVGRVMIRSRSGMPFWRFSLSRAWALISAIFTPCGQTCEQIPQPEQ